MRLLWFRLKSEAPGEVSTASIAFDLFSARK
jgi:hypothetical protein